MTPKIDEKKYNMERLFMFKKAIDMTTVLTPINEMFDMACNNGYWLNTAQRFLPDTNFTGMDTLDFSDRGWKTFSNDNINFIQGNSLKYLKDREQQYDMVLCMGIMYYYNNIYEFLDITLGASKSTVLIDTFCFNSEISEERQVFNPPNTMVEAAEEHSDYVTIPTESKIMEYLDEKGFISYKIDDFSESWGDRVGQRLDLDIKRSCILAIRKNDYIGHNDHHRMFKSPI